MTTQTKHTAGPWIALDKYTNRQAIPVGHCIGNGAYSIFAEAHGHNYEANARLIAAAPELLEALNYYTEMHSAHINEMPDRNENEGKQWRRTLDIARAALAKARGEQS